MVYKDLAKAIRAAWLEHHVLSFPDQDMNDDALEAFTLMFGNFGEDPFIAPIPGREHVIAVERLADETSPLFAENWQGEFRHRTMSAMARLFVLETFSLLPFFLETCLAFSF